MRRACLAALFVVALTQAPACKKSKSDPFGTDALGGPPGLSLAFAQGRNGESIGVEIRVNGPEANEVRELRVTRGWGGTHPLTAIENLEARDAKGPINVGIKTEKGAFSALPLSRPPEGGALLVRYFARAPQTVSRLSLHRSPGGFSGVGHSFIARPAIDKTLPFSIKMAGSFQPMTLTTTLDEKREASVEDLAAAVYVLGPVQNVALPSGDRATLSAGTALDGNGALQTADAACAFAARTFGRDGREGGERLRLFVLGEQAMGRGHDGAQLGGAISVWIDAERTLDDAAKILFAHEALHKLFGEALRVDARGRDAAWFSEGFTTHYARRALFEEGRISAEAFLEDVARSHDDDAGSALDGGAHSLGYGLGSRYAALLDTKIRSNTDSKQSLDDLVRSLDAIAKKTPGAPVPVAVFREALAKLIGEKEERALWDGLVIGALPELPSDAFGPCFKHDLREVTVPSLGFDRGSLTFAPQIIRGTEKGSAAERAGVRDGAIVLATSLGPGQPISTEMTVELVLSGPKGKQVVRFTPAKKVMKTVFVPNPCDRKSAKAP